MRMIWNPHLKGLDLGVVLNRTLKARHLSRVVLDAVLPVLPVGGIGSDHGDRHERLVGMLGELDRKVGELSDRTRKPVYDPLIGTVNNSKILLDRIGKGKLRGWKQAGIVDNSFEHRPQRAIHCAKFSR